MSEIKQNDFMARFIISPLKNGVIGFITFFLFLIMIKYISYIIGNQNYFRIEFEDVLLSLIGLILFFLIRLLENFHGETDRMNQINVK